MAFIGFGIFIGFPIGWLVVRLKRNSGESNEEELKLQLKLETERSMKLTTDFNQLNQELRNERELPSRRQWKG